MPPILVQPIPHLLTRLHADTSRWIIGMAGVPGSGKSTLVAQFAAEINAQTAPGTLIALGMDGFHLPKAALRQFPDPEQAFARRGAPWTFDSAALLARLQRVRAGFGRETVPWPGFQHEIGDPIEAAFLVPSTTRLVIVEGLYLLQNDTAWNPICQFFDERWYLDTPIEIALERLAQRHMAVWGWAHAAAQQRIDTNDRLNAELVVPSREQADWRLA